MDEAYYEALKQCGTRYLHMIIEHIELNYRDTTFRTLELYEFIKEFRQGCSDRLPLNKLNRWLGYIQGTLISLGLTTVEAERNWTRPLFRPLDFPEQE